MKKVDKKDFLCRSVNSLDDLYEGINSLETLQFANLDSNRSMLIMVDMINGFIKEGALSSPLIEDIIEPIKQLISSCNEVDIPVIAFVDSHTENSAEFSSYPIHCIEDTSESEIVEDLINDSNYIIIKKNSTNGFIEKVFQEKLITNPQINTFVVVGCCTDICVMQFCLTLKTYFNSIDKNVDIIVPVNCVETFDLGNHESTLMNIMSLQLMQNAGIKLVKAII